ncbi:SUN domain-containing ossification factor isoform X3 [Pimephales promelas]|uniref:SUN domain-containing ossification factor isoform X3 n=1 Tax=Pimephales promelas TaxID=90988 RepID=UPI0019559BA5|nr:SUN domain-containing ossification factor isoform X3 [Pimephales promelas]KAG1964635.1 SUN domain-containing ossification factor [Pimephales promelas]
MKKLRVLLLCAVLVLLCWHSCRHVYCSEEISSGPGLPAQDDSRYTTEESGTDKKVEEERATRTQSSHSVGLETETAALKETPLHSQDTPHEHKQTVNLEEVLEDQQIQLDSALPELEQQQQQQQPEPQNTQQQDQQQQSAQPPTLTQPQTAPHLSQTQPDPETPQATATEDQAAHATTALTPPQSDPHGEDPSAPAAELQKSPEPASPTSASSSESPSSGLDVPHPDAPVENSSASQCEVGSVPPFSQPLDTTLTSVVEEHAENQSTTLGQSTETSADPTASLVPSELDLTETGQTDSILPPTESPQQVVDHEGSPDPPVPSKEDIPTFDEWKKKVMEVEEKKSQSLHTSSNGSPHPVKKVQKNFKNNYASVECGAKILSANNEAKSTSAILMENMDLYMLNPCSTKIWFVIELCEPIQVKQLDIANFELFSSTPKDFLVSISDRYPTNKWIKLGTFHARDERTVQSFPLDEQLYAKYVKVELLSHFGSEHFCPLSLIRVFGTSMVEEYDEIADSQYTSERTEYLDEDYDYPPGYMPSEDKASKNLLGSATNAILNMVNNIAANVLGGKPELEDGAEMEGNVSSGTENVTQDSTETTLTPDPTPTEQPVTLDILELDPTLVKDDSEDPVPEAPSEPPPEESRIVILIEEDEEVTQPTVTLLEEEQEEEKRPEEIWETESATYCGHLSTLSCLASLHEHFYCYCSAALALQRQRRDRRHKTQHAHTDTDTQTAPQQSVSATTPTQEPPAPSEKLPEAERPSQAQTERISPTETVAAPPQSSSWESAESERELPPETIILEPSHTSTLPPHSFSDTPTQNIPESLPVGQPVDQHPQYPVDIPETRASGSICSSAQSPTSSMLSSTTTETSSPETDPPILELPVPTKEQTVQPMLTHTRPADIPPPTELPIPLPEASDNGRATGAEDPHHSAVASQPELSEVLLSQQEEAVDDILLPHRTAGDFYAEQQQSVEMGHGNGNGNQVHGSNQKESVFMRLNNRIKALEMNMSLSSRYLEELSQRYRKQMEEMQRAFNKTIIKLQNTSRIAEEQDQKQTESIQMLQSQLENATKIMLNLSATVAQLQREVSDRQSYLVLSLILCLTLGLLLCMQCCRSSPNHNTSSVIPVSNHYPSPKRCFSSYDDMSLKRRVSCPLVRSKSFQLPTSEVGPDDLYIVEPLRFSPEKKKKRCKTKAGDRVETLGASVPSVPAVNGEPRCNGESSCSLRFLPSTCNGFTSRDCASEESSASTLSEESFGCAPVMNGLCNGAPPPKSKVDKRSLKRRRSRNAEQQPEEMMNSPVFPVTVMPALQELMKGKDTFGRTAVTGRV